MFKKCFFFVAILSCLSIFSQEVTVSGFVFDENNSALKDVSLFIFDSPLGTFTKTDGSFILKIPSKRGILEVSYLGYKLEKIDISTLANLSKVNIILKQDLLSLDEVVVTAKKEYSKEGSSVYKIGVQSMKQIQSMNLSDILGLLPGNSIAPPDLSKTQQANIRSAIVSDVNAFGTSVILDGAVTSNDANLQALNPSSSLDGRKSPVGGGVDLRSISLVNIGSVEVVNGISSPKYGNLSNGTIILKSKVGASPLSVNANITATNYQLGVSKGLALKRWGIVNTDFSYSYSSGSPIERKTFFQNFNFGTRWKLPVFDNLDWNHFTSFRVVYSDDGNRHEPDEVFKNESDVKSFSYQLATSGDFSSKIGHINYNFSTNITNQYSYIEQQDVFGPYPIIESLKAGIEFTTFTPASFEVTTEVRGQPINFNARVELTQQKSAGNFDVDFETGLQYNYDVNKGKGRTVTGNIARTTNEAIGSAVGNRSANFENIPASKIFSAYHQTRVKRTGENSKQRLNLGIRYDYMLERFNLFSPRLSASSKHGNLNFRMAFGVSHKAPAMVQLNPGKIFIDYTNLIYFANNPAERLAIVTTYIQQPDNSNLRSNVTNLKEFGFDWRPSFLDFQATFFIKDLKRGIQPTNELVLLPRQEYEVVSMPVNEQPIVVPTTIVNIPRVLNIMKNNYNAKTNGVELVVNSNKIKATNTQFNFRYSYLESVQNDTRFKIRNSSFVIGENTARFGVYSNNQRRVYRSFGTLTIIQHIPALRFVVTLATELNFKNYSKFLNASLYPFAYYDIDGNFNQISESDINSGNFEDLRLPERTFFPDKTPFIANFNLQVRKETVKGHSFSFFANNAPWYNPIRQVDKNNRRFNTDVSVGINVSLNIDRLAF
ncbi:MAG: ferric enterobactin receptor [Polaribacter sp.]